MKISLKNALVACLPALLCVALFQPITGFAQTYKGFSVGQYQGQARNKTGNTVGTGKATLTVQSIAADGRVRAYLLDSDGLEGAGALTGAINANGVLQLSGPMTSPSDKSVWQSAFMAIMQNGQLRMGNKLTLGSVVQEETATMAYAGGPATGNVPIAAANNAPTIPTGTGAPTEAEIRAYFSKSTVDYWASLDYKQVTVSYQKILMAPPVRYDFVGAGWQVCYAVKLDYIVNKAMLPPNSTHYYSTRYTNDLYRLYRNEFGELTVGDHIPGQMTDLK